MTAKLKPWLGAFCAVCLGCSPVANAVRTDVVEPTEYSRRVDDCVDHQRITALADAAWDEFEAAGHGATYSPDFELGFREGFGNYLFKGGTGLPPPLPPRYYWRPEYQNPAGQQAIHDWFIGYRRGAAIARESGYRRLITIPASTSLPRRTMPMRMAPLPTPPAGEQLPPPREVQPPSPAPVPPPPAGKQQEPAPREVPPPPAGEQQEPPPREVQALNPAPVPPAPVGKQQQPAPPEVPQPPAGEQQQPAPPEVPQPPAGEQQQPAPPEAQPPSAGEQELPALRGAETAPVLPAPAPEQQLPAPQEAPPPNPAPP